MTINHKALLVFSFLAKGSISLALIGNDVQRPFKPPTTVAAGLRTESQQRIRMSLYASRPSSLETSTSLQYKTKESGGDNNDSDGSSPAVTISEEQSCEIEEFRKERRKRDYDRLVGGLAESNDLTRENARLDSLSSYLIVSCLTGTASYATIESLRLESTATDVHVFYNLAMVAASLGALSGIYATVVFSLCATVSVVCNGKP